MKKIIFVLLFFAFLFISQTSFAKAQTTEIITPSPTPTPRPVDYQLPYPGLLPDSPLYNLKVVRDRIIDFLISDPFKKAEFNLLMADKRLNAGIYLLKKNNKKEENLAYSTISKGENYFWESISKIREAKKQGRETTNFLKKLSLSAKKHKEVLKSLEMTVSPVKKGTLAVLEKRVDDFEKEVDGMIPK